MSAPLRVLCADDEPHALEALQRLVTANPSLELVASCRDGASALAQAVELEPDLMILDVRMPGATGLDVVAALPPEARPLVVFATAHDDHAVEAFDLHAVDYLLKPFDDDRFERALERARERLRSEGPDAGRERLEGMLEERGEDRLAIHREGQLVLVPFGDILWVEAADQYVRVHLDGGGEELMRASMGHMEKRLPVSEFLRVHRSAIVARRAVRGVQSATSGTGRMQLVDGTSVPVSRTRLALVRKALG
ncbi:MAG: LytTR family DNA-binding domain-containing protein [Planctomycetota bacterium]